MPSFRQGKAYPLSDKETRSERDSNPRYQFPGIPHFQAVGEGCKRGYGGAVRIHAVARLGTTEQARAPTLGRRWVC